MARKSTDDPLLDKAVHDTTLEERKKGWLDRKGPFTEAQLRERLGPLFVVNRRFGVRQGEAIRAIDNYSSSFVNLGYGTPWKLEFGG